MQAVSVTPEMAYDLMQVLRSLQVEFVVAPYEADSQLAYLASIPTCRGGVAAVITEDSDLVALGCQTVLFKMDPSGYVQELSLDRLFTLRPSEEGVGDDAQASSQSNASGSWQEEKTECESSQLATSSTSSRPSKQQKQKKSLLFFEDWNQDMLRGACILAGCDFVRSLNGISFRTAHKWVEKTKMHQPWTLERLLDVLLSQNRWMNVDKDEYRENVS